jgi:adenine/guanine/hypoxanthine permease
VDSCSAFDKLLKSYGARGMFVYAVLNTMIWAVVRSTNGRVTPKNYEQKEVYNWTLGKRDMPTWMRKIVEMSTGNRQSDIASKETIELADTDSIIRASSHNGSTEDKRQATIMSHPQLHHDDARRDSMR